MAQAVEAAAVSEDVRSVVSKMTLVDDMDETLSQTSWRILDNNRRKIYGAFLPQLSDESNYVIAVECKNSDNEISEKLVIVSKDLQKSEDLLLECKITMEDFPPSHLVEFQFNDSNGDWYLSQMCLSALEHYRTAKFKIWLKMIKSPDCEAAFRRLLRIGLITNIFDYAAFPSPESEANDWKVKDKNGRDVIIPRPVYALRVWNAEKQAYGSVNPHLGGAPDADGADKYWTELLTELKEMHGAEYVDKLLDPSRDNEEAKEDK